MSLISNVLIKYFSFLPDEKTIFEDLDCWYRRFTEEDTLFGIWSQGHLIVTNKRIIIIRYKFKTSLIYKPKIIGYESLSINYHISDAISVETYPRLREINVNMKDRKTLVLKFRNKEMKEKYYKELSELLVLTKDQENRKEVIQYSVTTKFEFGSDGAILIQCPNCSASSSLQYKSNPIRCPYCNKEYMVPKKILELI